MKKIFYKTLLVLLISQISYGQEIQKNGNPTLSKEEFMRKSKSQKTAGTILIVSGSASLVAGLVISFSEISKWNEMYDPAEKTVNEAIPAVLCFAGLAGIVAGGVFLKASKKNMKRATSISFRNEVLPGRRPSGIAAPSMPVATLSIKF